MIWQNDKQCRNSSIGNQAYYSDISVFVYNTDERSLLKGIDNYRD